MIKILTPSDIKDQDYLNTFKENLKYKNALTVESLIICDNYMQHNLAKRVAESIDVDIKTESIIDNTLYICIYSVKEGFYESIEG